MDTTEPEARRDGRNVCLTINETQLEELKKEETTHCLIQEYENTETGVVTADLIACGNEEKVQEEVDGMCGQWMIVHKPYKTHFRVIEKKELEDAISQVLDELAEESEEDSGV